MKPWKLPHDNDTFGDDDSILMEDGRDSLNDNVLTRNASQGNLPKANQEKITLPLNLVIATCISQAWGH